MINYERDLDLSRASNPPYIPVLRQLSKMEYEELLIRVYEDTYVLTQAESQDDYQCGKHIFFIVRRNSNNYVIYIDDNYE